MKGYFAGVDIGSTNSKACIINLEGEVLGYAQNATGSDRGDSGETAFSHALEDAKIERESILHIGATGYGRRKFEPANVVYPEVICHASGAEKIFPGVRTVLDVGGQDCKVIQCQEGLVMKFEMNDKCAAGTGRFFEVLAGHLLGVSIDEVGSLALQSNAGARISSMCTVFAESEIVSMLSQGVPTQDICRGLIEAMFRRIRAMAGSASIPLEGPIVFMGGMARCSAAKPILEEMVKSEVLVPEIPQLPAALGAALMARDDFLVDHS